jgi:FkbM family methyltransferase
MKNFEKDIINVLYDADADCVAQITYRNQILDSELHVLPYALGDICKSGVLNINYDPFTSSLFEKNNSYDSFYMFNQDHDYIWGETTKTIEKRDVELVSIDHIFKLNGLTFPKPDFLSIDVEGGEYGVIEGASETMKCSILAINAEVSFHPFHTGQKSFSELCVLLSSYGFYFATFANSNGNIYMEEMTPYRYPIGLRGAGFHTLSEALFLRKIDVVEDMFPESSTRYINLRKLAFISIVCNQIEYGLECLKHSRLIEHENKPDESSVPNYFKFLRELEKIVEIQPQIFPQTFSSKYSFEQSKARFNSNESKFKGKLKKMLSKIPIIYKLMLNIYIVIIRFKKYLSVLRITFRLGHSKFEKTFIKYGLLSQAHVIRKKRILQSRYI